MEPRKFRLFTRCHFENYNSFILAEFRYFANETQEINNLPDFLKAVEEVSCKTPLP